MRVPHGDKCVIINEGGGKGVTKFQTAPPLSFSHNTKRRAPPLSHCVGLELGPRFLPGPVTTFTKRRLYCRRFLARPFGVFFLSCLATCV